MPALRISDHSLNWSISYVSNGSFQINIKDKYSCIAKIDWKETKDISRTSVISTIC